MAVPARRRRWLLPVAILVGAVVLMVVLASMRKPPPQRPQTARTPVVDTVTVQVAPHGFEVRAQGNVMPRTQTTLVSEVAGVVQSVGANFAAGGFVRRGEVLLTIDPKDYEVAVVRAEAALAGRQALLAQERARAEQAARDWAGLDRPGAPNELVLRKPQLAEAEANVRSAEADLAAARINLERTRVRAPFDGLLREKRADVGQFVNVGAALALIAATDVAEIRLPLTQADLAVVALPEAGQAVDIELVASHGDGRRPARLVRTEGVLDERTRVMFAVAELADPYARGGGDATPLPFGTFVDARLPARLSRPVIAVPRHALRGMDQLLIADADDRLRLRSVEVIRGDAQHVYVGAGLAAGERVITTVIATPVEGMALRVAGAERAAEAGGGPAADAAGEATTP